MEQRESSQPHLLVVDDDAEILALIERYFSSQGFRVSMAASGTAMRAAIQADAIDIVLLDLGLPREDGLDLTRYLRAHLGRRNHHRHWPRRIGGPRGGIGARRG